jgi:ribosome-binding ATPase YchF (GTP1/OBG family)
MGAVESATKEVVKIAGKFVVTASEIVIDGARKIKTIVIESGRKILDVISDTWDSLEEAAACALRVNKLKSSMQVKIFKAIFDFLQKVGHLFDSDEGDSDDDAQYNATN